MIAPGATLGVLGGGQLGRMFAMAAHRLGYRVAVLDPDRDCPAAGVANVHICAALDDHKAWHALAGACAAVTIETESAPAEALAFFAARLPVAPGEQALRITQDRAREKRFLAANGFGVVPFRVIATEADAAAPDIDALLPGLLKASRFGYDGKGQFSVRSRQELVSAARQLGGPGVLEQRVELAAELSVILARSADGATAVHPVPLNRHASGILDLSVVPAPLPHDISHLAVAESMRLAALLDYRGVLCVEFFLTADDRLLVNEIAPRPHNSGHFTLDACHTSQFEQQVRVLAGLPLGDPGLTAPHHGVAMANLLGQLWAEGEPRWEEALSNPHARLHLYGKSSPRPGRKMGHLTCIADSATDAQALASRIRSNSRPTLVPESAGEARPARLHAAASWRDMLEARLS
ncbi:MAG: 5-(carboxyamino)imidazole ribonucleotide synthase [Burkholderiales bacterium]|nr:5-(carboxyamino)imidazole ribonucleotide synthase [Burkholderiales bacterium]